MKWNNMTGPVRFLVLAGSILVLAGLMLSGCSGPSQITVSGIGTVQSEMPFLPEGSAADEMDTGEPAKNTIAAEPAKDSVAVKPAKDSMAADPAKDSMAAESVKGSDPRESVQIAVYVCGAVKKPGVCYLPSGARVCDALEAAGGFTKSADSQWLNQAELLYDGEMLIVYTSVETAQMKEQGILPGDTVPAHAISGSAGSSASVPSANAVFEGAGGEALVNLNTASKEQLMTLPGIGEAKADAIIRYRTETGLFASTEDVMNISGIKNSVYEKIRDKVTV